MAVYFHGQNLKGFAHWFQVQAKEEMGHAQKFYTYLMSRNEALPLKLIAQPTNRWTTPIKALEDAYDHERSLTASIQKLADLAQAEKSHDTYHFLEWAVKEQVEEETQAFDLIHKAKLLGIEGRGLYFLDHELSKRE